MYQVFDFKPDIKEIFEKTWVDIIQAEKLLQSYLDETKSLMSETQFVKLTICLKMQKNFLQHYTYGNLNRSTFYHKENYKKSLFEVQEEIKFDVQLIMQLKKLIEAQHNLLLLHEKSLKYAGIMKFLLDTNERKDDVMDLFNYSVCQNFEVEYDLNAINKLIKLLKPLILKKIKFNRNSLKRPFYIERKYQL